MLSVAEDVPTTLQTLLAFASFIVPGFLLRAGYVRSRVRGKATADLHVLAEAVVGSLAVLGVAWWWHGRDVVTWAQQGTLLQHEAEVYWFFAALLFVPYPAGLIAGWAVNGLANLYNSLRPQSDAGRLHKYLFHLLDTGGVFTSPTVWDQVWAQVTRRRGIVLVRIRTKTGGEAIGTFEWGGVVGLSPDPFDVYLRRVYRLVDGFWEPVANSEGILIRDEAIESVEFLWGSPTGSSTDARSPAGNGESSGEDPGGAAE
jgi:Family of unknown function (DUF6338)